MKEFNAGFERGASSLTMGSTTEINAEMAGRRINGESRNESS